MDKKPVLHLQQEENTYSAIKVEHPALGDYHFYFEKPARTLFTENETNTERLYGQPNPSPYVKDVFHTAVTENNFEWLKEKKEGTKCAPMYEFTIDAQAAVTIQLRLSKQQLQKPLTRFGNRLNHLLKIKTLLLTTDFHLTFVCLFCFTV